MYNTANPAELYAGTTWELLPDNKFLKTGSTPLQQASSNSIKLSKANLPTDKLQVESHYHTQPTHKHSTPFWTGEGSSGRLSGWASNGGQGNAVSNLAGGENTGSSAPYTTAMGPGTPLNINPEHITIRAWKRLS